MLLEGFGWSASRRSRLWWKRLMKARPQKMNSHMSNNPTGCLLVRVIWHREEEIVPDGRACNQVKLTLDATRRATLQSFRAANFAGSSWSYLILVAFMILLASSAAPSVRSWSKLVFLMTVYVAPNPRRLKSMIAGTIAHRIGTAFV